MADRFENNIFGMVKAEDWLQVGYDVERPNDPTSEVWGDVKTDNLIAYWESIAAEYNIPVMAQFHAFDVEAQKTLRIPIDVNNVEKGLIKVKIDQLEKKVEKHNQLVERTYKAESDIKTAFKRYDDLKERIERLEDKE